MNLYRVPRLNLKRFAILGIAVASLGVVAVLSAGLSSSSSPRRALADSSSSTASIPCPPTPPGQPAPACQNGSAVVLPAPASQWPTTGTQIAEGTAVAAARRAGGSAAASAPAYAQVMTYQAAANLIGESANPSLDPLTSVWVVTVDAPLNTYSWTAPVPQGQSPESYVPPSQPTYSTYTMILDAFNGAGIDVCTPCAGKLSTSS